MKYLTNINLSSDFFDNQVRFDKIYHLGTMISDDSIADDLREEVEYDLEQIASALEVKESILEELNEDFSAEAFSSMLYIEKKLGFLCKAASPAKTVLEGGTTTYCWSNYRTAYIYAETFEDVCSQAIDWANSLKSKPE